MAYDSPRLRSKAGPLGAAVLSLGLIPTALSAEPPAPARPNVVCILADDLGYGDVAFQGCRDIPTPNLDALTKQGVKCTQGYVCMPYCAPSRAGLITGCYPQRFGFEDNPDPVLDPKRGLRAGRITIADVMRSAGYVTGAIGKWHLGTAAPYQPLNRGFDEHFGYLGGAHTYIQPPQMLRLSEPIPEWYTQKVCETTFARRPKDPLPEWYVNQTLPILRQGQLVEEHEYLTDAFTREAVSFIERHKSQPFFLYLAHSTPHHPYEVTEEYLKPFSSITDKRRQYYAAMVHSLDVSVGRVMQTLRDNHLEQNTLVVFLSDNGAGTPPSYAGSNAPFRGHKGQHYEGGIHVPFVWVWPGHLPAGVAYDHPVSSLDILTTAAGVGEAKLPADQPFDGVNLIPYLQGQKQSPPHEYLFWRQGGGNYAAVRDARYKLIFNGENGRNRELYDLQHDPGENANIAAENSEVVNRLLAAYAQWNTQMIPPLWRSMR